MQLTLDDLRKASDPLAALLAMSDSDLDRVAAESIGWELVSVGWWARSKNDFRDINGLGPCTKGNAGYNTPSAVKWEGHLGKAGAYMVGNYFMRLDEIGEPESMAVVDYQPSRKLDQAYALMAVCRAKCDLYHSRVEDWNETYHELGKPNDADGFYLHESQAGSHARAVVVLAILGLLQSRKDGGA